MSMRYLMGLGDPRVGAFREVQPRQSAGRLARWLIAAFVVLAAALAFIPWQQSAFGEGRVVAYSPTERQQRIDAPIEGWLSEWLVQEGTRVEAGAPIVRIIDNDPKFLERLQAEQAAAHARLEASERALQTALSNVNRQWRLFNQGLSSRKQYEEAQLKEADILKELTAARAELARVDTRLARQGRQEVTAPRAGVILRRVAGEGSVYVKTGDPLALLVPETRSRAVELWVDGNHVPLLDRGREVRLQFEGWPALQFSGWPGMSVGTFAGEVAIIDAADAAEPGRFRVLITPEANQPWPQGDLLRQGIRAHGWILLNQVPLGYELWRRFNNFPPVMPKALRESSLQVPFDEGAGKNSKSEGAGEKKAP